MNLEETIRKAEQGDPKSMLSLADYYMDREHFNLELAGVWSKKAAETGSPAGLEAAMCLYSATALLSRKLNSTDEEIKNWMLVSEWADIARKKCFQDSKYYQKAQEHKNDAEFGLAYAYFVEKNYTESILHNSRNTPLEQLLLGLCSIDKARDLTAQKMITQEEHNAQIRQANRVIALALEDAGFFNKEKTQDDEVHIFTLAVISYASYVRLVEKDVSKAYVLLNRAEQVVNHRIRRLITEDKSKYHKKLFGGYVYRE